MPWFFGDRWNSLDKLAINLSLNPVKLKTTTKHWTKTPSIYVLLRSSTCHHPTYKRKAETCVVELSKRRAELLMIDFMTSKTSNLRFNSFKGKGLGWVNMPYISPIQTSLSADDSSLPHLDFIISYTYSKLKRCWHVFYCFFSLS